MNPGARVRPRAGLTGTVSAGMAPGETTAWIRPSRMSTSQDGVGSSAVRDLCIRDEQLLRHSPEWSGLPGHRESSPHTKMPVRLAWSTEVLAKVGARLKGVSHSGYYLDSNEFSLGCRPTTPDQPAARQQGHPIIWR